MRWVSGDQVIGASAGVLLICITLIIAPVCQSSSRQATLEHKTFAPGSMLNTKRTGLLQAQTIEQIKTTQFDQAERAAKATLSHDVSFGPTHNTLGCAHDQQERDYLAAWEFQYATKPKSNSFYGEQVHGKRITPKSLKSMPKGSLLTRLGIASRMKQVVPVDGKEEGWKKNVAALELNVVADDHADRGSGQCDITLLLAKLGGNTMVFENHWIVIVTDYAITLRVPCVQSSLVMGFRRFRA